MKYAILGDVHANQTALLRVLEEIEREAVSKILSVGDVVGYGPSPRECIELLQERGVEVVLGNHDAACAGELDDRLFNNYARVALRWTRKAIGRMERNWLRALPLTRRLEHCEVAHGSFFQPERFHYTQTPQDADPSLDRLVHPAGFVGHTHVPIALQRRKGGVRASDYILESEFAIPGDAQCLVNVGSVGQPRDEDPRAAYCIFDSEERSVAIRRVAYDIHREAELSKQAGLPRVLADRLFLGV